MKCYPKVAKVAKVAPVEKPLLKYNCNLCDYNTSKKSSIIKHFTTIKHKKQLSFLSIPNYPKVANVQNTKKDKKVRHFCDCGKNYQFKSGLCKHKKKCENTIDCSLKKGTPVFENSPEEVDKVKNNEKIKMLEGELSEIKSVLKDFIVASTNNNATQTEIISKYAKNMDKMSNIMVDNKTVNITNNQNVTINVFLNEQCKDAMNLTDWIENIKVTLEDLQYTKDNGFVNGVTNIISKQLQDLKPTERPIHCSDKKRLHFYVKDNDEWTKDVDNKKLDSTITHIKLKQSKSITEWEELHPTYRKDAQLLDEWCSILAGITEGDTGNALKEKVSLKRKIASYIEIKEAMANN